MQFQQAILMIGLEYQRFLTLCSTPHASKTRVTQLTKIMANIEHFSAIELAIPPNNPRTWPNPNTEAPQNAPTNIAHILGLSPHPYLHTITEASNKTAIDLTHFGILPGAVREWHNTNQKQIPENDPCTSFGDFDCHSDWQVF